ncbi:MAG: aldo/keto reductase [Thermoflexales bacterium]|nr:aldo/keto reductase [Thermoflexales bacterium]MDW8350786.1 aldo/keto reductase [Anaerolineae bacterium]
MQTRRLGYTDLHLSAIGLGAWAMGGSGWKFSWGAQDDRDSIATIHRAVELGINWIDTAPVYGLGHSEEVVGRALKQLGAHRRPIIATKCGRKWDAAGVPYADLHPNSIRAEIDASLRRLGVEVIDLYQMHWPQPDEMIEEAWGAMADGVRAGKIRYIGVCNYNVAQMKRLQPIHPIASLQPPYSMLVRGVEAETLAFCAANNIGVVCYSPMQKGILTDKFSRAWVEQLPDDDHRKQFDERFKEPQLSRNLALVEQLKPIAHRSGHTVAQLAVAWVLRRPEVTSAIVGARKPSQIEETVAAGDWNLSPQEIAEIDALLTPAVSA